MKKLLNATLACLLTCSLAGCNNETTQPQGEDTNDQVELNVTTTFAGEDGNAKNFKDAVEAYEDRKSVV